MCLAILFNVQFFVRPGHNKCTYLADGAIILLISCEWAHQRTSFSSTYSAMHGVRQYLVFSVLYMLVLTTDHFLILSSSTYANLLVQVSQVELNRVLASISFVC